MGQAISGYMTLVIVAALLLWVYENKWSKTDVRHFRKAAMKGPRIKL